MTSTRLWELSEEIQQLENAIALIADDKTLTEEDREIKLQETFNQWLSKGESFKVKAEQVARYIRHQEAIAEARKIEARRIRELASQAENGAARLRKYLIDQMIRSNVQKIDGVSTKIGLRKKQQEVLLNVSPEKLPAEYVKVTYQPDLTKIRKLLKADAQGAIAWASLSESHQYSVTIR
ncbi:hypothetical protein C7B62_19080 [Pleurocapsa sp. CCALA 161]|uniref:siphovirus Gp157 family protein n=1 Tax=Pleurocapsa sp. CCALA 161 TaxID=2107688 RepID=UPI000D05C617|nr:siphovirus Gp157 family protein [Pleurocapsa sp. CCALA 161]PSB07721.1 hypothetical protein C7B62_19080 [Pleurocapsa sp. CCALA 161]